MAKKLTSVIGIDIGSHAIKVAELRTKGREAELVSVGITETPEGAVDHTGVYNSDAVGDTLKQLLKSSEIKSGPVVVSLAGQASVLVRTLEVPRMTPTELKEHMAWEINRNIPFAESNVLSDYKVLPDDDPNSPNMEVVMALAPQSAIDTLVACIKRAGKQAVGIDVEPLAIARSLEFSHGDEYRDQVVCMVEMGGKTTAINIYRNGRLLMPRQIPIGGEMFTKAIADTYMLGLPDAETMKRERAVIPEGEITAAEQGGAFMPTFGDADGATQEFGAYNPFSDQPITDNPFLDPSALAPAGPGANYNPFADAPSAAPVPGVLPMDEPPAMDPGATASFNPFSDDPVLTGGVAEPSSAVPAVAGDPESARLFNSFRPVLEEFVAEIRRSVDYFRSRGGDVNRIVLAGGGNRIGGLDRYVAASMSLPCDPYDSTAGLRINEKKIAAGFIEENKQDLTIAIGTALHILFD